RGEIGEEDLDLVVLAQAHEAEPFVLVFDDGDRFAVVSRGGAHHIGQIVEVVRIADIDVEGSEAVAGIGQALSEIRHASIDDAATVAAHDRMPDSPVTFRVCIFAPQLTRPSPTLAPSSASETRPPPASGSSPKSS